MSLCPSTACGRKGQHVAVIAYWGGGVFVRHRCIGPTHPESFEWDELARDPMAAFRAASGLEAEPKRGA